MCVNFASYGTGNLSIEFRMGVPRALPRVISTSDLEGSTVTLSPSLVDWEVVGPWYMIRQLQ